MKRINGLIFTDDTTGASTETSDQEVQRSDLYAQVKAKLTSTERNLQEQRDILDRVKEEWSTALGDADLARTTMEELESKHAKKWSELTVNGFEDDSLATSFKGSSEDKTLLSSKNEAEQIVTLRHKLTQALENVRQAETTRHTLSEAILMNDSLQYKLEELKGKYAALQAARASSTHASSSSNSNTTAATPKLKSSSNSSSTNLTQSAEKVEKNNEKLLRDYKRLRKELAMVTASKEAAKAKLERNEKERDALIQTNSRLLKQTAEKDEMNAKSLSTILHLKQLTEQISKEKASLDQQAKSAHQLALAARLASNARDRVAEEFLKDRLALEKCAGEWEQKFSNMANEKELMNEKMFQQKAKMSALLRDFTKAKARCDELATESTKLTEDTKNVLEKLAVTQREALEAASRLDSMARQRPTSGGGGGGTSDNNSEFTVDQLNTQVSVLKGRLACPVCNHRDKKCILLRCRHMFCKVCVDENIKNRSRKCPACGQRFDTKDVADVWL
jgi:E3 ubiquitin-protein ligase BRE1